MNQIRPFADTVLAYAQAGWPAILPVPPEKSPPPVGFTGADGRDTDPMQLAMWAGTHAGFSIALRMPDGVIGIDVDDYVKAGVRKHGQASMQAAVDRWGPLPPTWTSTARGPGTSGIRFYRTPVGRYATKLDGGDVEIIQRHHRYAVVWPSPHKDAGDIYRWYDPAGVLVEQPPKPGELPELPASWVAGLAEGATDAGPQAADIASGHGLLTQLLADDRAACAEIASAALTAVAELTKADAGSRHDTAIARVHHLVQLAAAGHPGLGRAVEDLTALWVQLTAGEDRAEEWDRMLLTSARKAVTAVGARQVSSDPCSVTAGGVQLAQPIQMGPAPVDDRPGAEPPEPIAPRRELHPREVIGAHLFDPRGHLDQTMAEAVLERMYPALRYAYDAQIWLRRQPVDWEPRNDLAEWAVAQLADLMPIGNPDAEKGSQDRDQAERRKRFMSAATSSAVAKKMRALVSGGAHPCALRVADLDSEPWLLWAGGVGWDLGASLDTPTAAVIDPATPHLQSAGVAPEIRPTPLWDAFTAAVWPDAELRAWALRVLSIAFTGYSDKALPILIGEKDRGKTQIIVLLMSVLGSYAHAADPRLLTSTDNAHASIVYALKGRRLSFIDEGPREGRLGQERLKQLTGGGELTGNQMRANPITFAPSHTLVLTANDEPVLTDPAVRSRVRLIPCEGDPAEVIAARAAIGHTSGPAWRREAPGVLATMMREAAAWLAEPGSASTAAAPEAYRYRAEEIAAAQEPVRNWLDEETEEHPDGERSRTLYEAFVGWCKNGNLHPGRIPSETKWGRELGRLGFPPVKRRDGHYRLLRIRPRGGWFGAGLPVSGAGLVQGSETNPAQPETPVKPGLEAPKNSTVQGVQGSHTLYAHTHAHDARTHARIEPPNSDLPCTPVTTVHSPATTGVTEQGDPAPTVHQPCTEPSEPEKPPLSELTRKLLAAKDAAHAADNAKAPVETPARRALSLEYAELKHQQDLRLESETRGVLKSKKRSGDSEEVLRYFGEGEFAGAGIEPRLTWQLFLEQRRPTVEYEKAQQASWDAGARLGRKHAAKSTPNDDADFDHASKRHDPDTFASGYAAGLIEHDQLVADAAGELVQLPAVVTRDGTVRALRLHEVVDHLESFGARLELTVDVETTGYPVGHADYALRTIQLGGEYVAGVFDATDPEQLRAAARLLERAQVLHAHSATADLVPLAIADALDIDLAWDRMQDTVIPAKLADPSSTGSDPGLKQLAGAMLEHHATAPAADEARAALFKAGKWLTDTKVTTPVERSGWAQVNSSSTTMIRYAASDVLDTAALAKVLPPVPPQLLERERTAQRLTARVAHQGLRIDGEHVDTKLPEHRAALAEAGARLAAFGITNPGSDQQVGAKLTELGAPLAQTKTGRPSVAKGVLEPLAKADGPIGDLVRARLEYQHHETVLGLFLEPYAQLVHRGDGRARPTVYTLGADTGRMSCVRPNLQQVPRQGGIRACITADPGQLLVSADFASVEIRVAAALSGDRNLQAMLAAGVDLHWEIARQVYGPEASKEDRYNVKRGVFGRLYGSGIPGIARTLAISEPEAASMVDTLDAMTPELTAWSRSVSAAVKAGHTQFPSYSGRVIHLPKMRPHAAPNYCIQGTARELLVDTLVRWRDTPWADAVLLPVHDEILLSIEESQAANATTALVAAMETTLLGVPIKAEASEPSFSWRDAS